MYHLSLACVVHINRSYFLKDIEIHTLAHETDTMYHTIPKMRLIKLRTSLNSNKISYFTVANL